MSFIDDVSSVLTYLISLDNKKKEEKAMAVFVDKLKSTNKIHTTEIVKGDKLAIPDNWTIDAAIEFLNNKKQEQETKVALSFEFSAFPWDGALALKKAIEEMFGFVMQVDQPGFFSDNPPALIQIATGPKTHVTVPWGRILLPNGIGYLDCGSKLKDERLVFTYTVQTKRKFDSQVNLLADKVREILEKDSLYRGTAVKIAFLDMHGESIAHNGGVPEPKFIDLSQTKRSDLVLNEDLTREIEHYVFGPIRFPDPTDAKLGVLLEGPPGTGKSLAMSIAAKYAVDAGRTVVYCENIAELEYTIKFAQTYSPAMIVVEDIDRTMGGDREVDTDRILNLLSGIESNKSDLMIVMTSNNADILQQPLLRPGRIDVSLHIPAPDAGAVQALLRLYGGDAVDPEEDYTEIGAALQGQIPAVIMEVVKRAKRSLRYRNMVEGTEDKKFRSGDLLVASKSMTKQLAMLNRKKPERRTDVQQVADALRDGLLAVANQNKDNLDKLLSGASKSKQEALATKEA